MRLDEPLETEAGADLLVCGGDKDQVAGAAPALAGERRHRDRRRSHLALHVERAAAPYLTVDQRAVERVTFPFGGVGEHDVGMRQERERGTVAGAADPRDEIGALGETRKELALDAGLLEVVAQQLGGRGLVPRRIRGVDANEPLEQLDDLSHFRVPRTSR